MAILDECWWLIVGWKSRKFKGICCPFVKSMWFLWVRLPWAEMGDFGVGLNLWHQVFCIVVSKFYFGLALVVNILGLWLVSESQLVFSLMVIGRAGDSRHTSGANLWPCFAWIGKCTTHLIVVSLLHAYLNSVSWMNIISVCSGRDESVFYHACSLLLICLLTVSL